MSIYVIATLLEYSIARGADRMVLLTIAFHLNRGDPLGFAWPSVARIARMANLSERQVKRSIQNLIALGELEVEPRSGKHGVNKYRLGPRLRPPETELWIPACCPCNPPVDCPNAEKMGRRVRKQNGRCQFADACAPYVALGDNLSPKAAAVSASHSASGDNLSSPLRVTACHGGVTTCHGGGDNLSIFFG